MYSDRKEINGCLEVGGESRKWQKRQLQSNLKTLRNDEYIHFLDCDDGFMSMGICQILTNFTL